MLWIAAIILLPMVSALRLGLYSTRQLIPRPQDYVGLHNYLRRLRLCLAVLDFRVQVDEEHQDCDDDYDGDDDAKRAADEAAGR